MRKYQVRARKYFIEKYELDDSVPYKDIAQRIVEESKGKVLFDNYSKNGAAQFIWYIYCKEIHEARQ